MLERILIAGSGGQGIRLTGKLLATAALNKVAHVTFFPSYGAEVRGGTSNCQIVLASDEIASPVSDAFDTMILMNQESRERFVAQAAPGCLVLLNTSMCEAAEPGSAIEVPATDIANELGDVRVANFVMLGACIGAKPILPPDEIEAGIAAAFRRKGDALVALNLQAFQTGLRRTARMP